jgi:hypothetical protein
VTVRGDGEKSEHLRFVPRQGKTATESLPSIKEVYGDNAVSCTWILKGTRRF